jgi:hypothetical protein
LTKIKSSFSKKWIFIGLPILIIFILLAFAYTKAEPYIEDKIQNFLQSQKINATFDRPELDILAGSLTIRNIKIKADSVKEMQGEIEAINVHGVSLWKYLFNDSIAVDNVSISSPSFTVAHSYTLPAGDTSKSNKPVSIGIDSISLTNGSFTYKTESGGIQIYNVSLGADQLRKIPNNPLNLQNFSMSMDSSVYVFPDSLYQLTLTDWKYTPSIETVSFTSGIHTLHTKEKVSSISGEEKDWIAIDPFSVEFTGLDVTDAVKTRRLVASHIHLMKPVVEVYRDKRAPDPNKADKKMPYQTLQELPVEIFIDSLSISEASITYIEKVSNTEQPGHIDFKNLNLSLKNITNMESVMDSTTRLATMTAQSDIMGVGHLNAYWTFPLDSAAGPHSIYGTMGPMDLTAYNPMMIYAAYGKINSGHQKSLEFNFTYDPIGSNGTMKFVYDELKIELLGDNPEEGGGFGDDIKTFFANTIIQNQNLLSEKSFRTGEINYERNPKKSLFNYWWKSLLVGFKSSIGLSSKKQDN